MSGSDAQTAETPTWRAGAGDRAAKLLAQATADALRAEAEPLAHRREVLLESCRRLTRLAEANLRVARTDRDVPER